MTTTTHDLSALSPLTRTEAVALGRVEYQRLVSAFTELHPEDWTKSTDCEGWTVRDLAGHVAGGMQTARGLRHLVAEQRSIKKRMRATGESEIDAMSAVQIERVAGLEPPQVLELMRKLVEPAAKGRSRIPEVIGRRLRFQVEMDSISERWDVVYLNGTILTRDSWLHRVADLARAVGQSPVLDTGHDGRIVADVAAEWCRRHGKPVALELGGPAGGSYTAGDGGPTIELDAVEFCRMLSGRAEPTHELLATEVPF